MSAADRLDQIDARAAAATRGPWEETASLDPDGRRSNHVTGPGDYDVCEVPRTPQGSEDSFFIAHARQDVPALVAALRAVLAELDRVKDVHPRQQFIHADALRHALDTHLGGAS